MLLRRGLTLVAVCMAANATWAGAASRSTAKVSSDPVVVHTAAVAGTYATVTGITPRDGTCGDPSAALVAAQMKEVVATGVTRIRCDLNWWTVQPYSRTSFNWSIYDNVVNAAGADGIKVLFVAGFTPPWARPNPLPAGTGDPSHVAPAKTSDFTNFVTAAAQRYSPVGTKRPAGLKGSVRQWEIWNEPNLFGFWTPPNPTVYGNFLKASAIALKTVDPSAIVISGGMAPAANQYGNYSPVSFVQGLIPTGVLAHIDGIGMHPYTFPAWAGEPVYWNPMVQAVPAMYKLIANAGYPGEKIWATEAGWPTSSQSPQTIRSDGTQVGTEGYQAYELVDIVHTWFQYPYAGPVFIYAQRDKCTDNTNWLCKMGIERFDGSHKIGYGTLKSKMTAKIGT